MNDLGLLIVGVALVAAGWFGQIALNLIASQLNPTVTRWRKKMQADIKKPAPLRPEEVRTVDSEIKGLKSGLEKITKFKNSISDFYLFGLEGIAFGIACVLLALFAGLIVGVGFVLLGSNPSGYGVNGEVYYYLTSLGFLLTFVLAALGFGKLLYVVETIRRVRDYDRFKAKVETRLAYLGQRLNDFHDLFKP